MNKTEPYNMKHSKMSFPYCIPLALVISLFFDKSLSAQVVPDLQAIVINGHIAIQVKNTATFASHFYPDADNKVVLDFYFEEDDPRNGTYSATPTTQVLGEVYLTFADIHYETGDTLTFSAIETLADASVKEYLFVEGVYVRGMGGPINVCPIAIECGTTGWKSFYIKFDKSSILVDLTTASNTTIYIYSPGFIGNGYYQGSGINVEKNALFFRRFPCEMLVSGEVIIMINGLICVFENGQLVNSSTSCSPWGDYYSGTEECATYFENCAIDIIELLSDNKNILPCRQWIDRNYCNTGAFINRSGKVAIGTSNFSASILTVKNGVLTDKVKVQTCNAGAWCDYVFDDDYPLMPLEEVEAYIEKYHHLPGIPSGDVIEAEGGFELGEITMMHQEKIEEVFLHLIALEKEVENLESVLTLFQFFEKTKVK